MSTSPRTATAEAATLTSVHGAAGTRQTILVAAQRLFERQGYDATSLRQIADAVGMTKAAVYYHYPAKEHLLIELTRPMIDALCDLVTTLRADDSEVRSPVVALERYLDLFIDHVHVFRLMAQDPATLHHPDIGQRLRHLVDAVHQLIAGADADGERLVRTGCAMGVVHSVAQLALESPHDQRQTILDSAVAALGSDRASAAR